MAMPSRVRARGGSRLQGLFTLTERFHLRSKFKLGLGHLFSSRVSFLCGGSGLLIRGLRFKRQTRALGFLSARDVVGSDALHFAHAQHFGSGFTALA